MTTKSRNTKYAIQPKKYLGQNFLQNEEIISKIVGELNISKNDFIIEIGGGNGAFTKHVIKDCDKYLKFFVYELDDQLIKQLKGLVSNCSNTHIQHRDFLDANIDKLYEPYRKQTSRYKIIGSIPYNITSPIIHKILRVKYHPDIIILVLQKEVADKLLNKAPNGSYWSNLILGYNIEKITKIHRNEFYPIPKVDSVAIKLTKNENEIKLIDEIGFDNWSKFLHHVFKNPRKMIKKVYNESILQQVGIDVTLRPQHISRDKLILLYKETTDL